MQDLNIRCWLFRFHHLFHFRFWLFGSKVREIRDLLDHLEIFTIHQIRRAFIYLFSNDQFRRCFLDNIHSCQDPSWRWHLVSVLLLFLWWEREEVHWVSRLWQWVIYFFFCFLNSNLCRCALVLNWLEWYDCVNGCDNCLDRFNTLHEVVSNKCLSWVDWVSLFIFLHIIPGPFLSSLIVHSSIKLWSGLNRFNRYHTGWLICHLCFTPTCSTNHDSTQRCTLWQIPYSDLPIPGSLCFL